MDLQKPSRTFDLKVGGEKQTLTMTYGLFNEIMRVIPSPENITSLIVTDAMLRDYVVRRVLTGNKRVEKDEDLVDPFELDVDIDDLDDLVAWVAEHVLHFFMRSAEKTAAIGTKYQDVIKTLIQSGQSLVGAEN